MLRLFSLSTGAGYSTYLGYDAKEAAVWEGRAAERLQLKGEVGLKEFELMRQGRHPWSGEVLRERAQRPGGIAMYDMVVAAPKSVSAVGIWDERLDQAHREAVGYVRQAAEERTMVQVNRKLEVSGELVQGVWHHENSRALDPQKHTHIATINMTWSETDQAWRAANVHQIYKDQYQLGEVYRYVLAHQVEELGYGTRERENGYGFEIAGVPESVLQKYSQRSHERDTAIEGFREYHEREPSREEVAILVRNHRPEKELGLEPAEIREMQIARLDQSERYALEHVYEVSFKNAERPSNHLPLSASGSEKFKGDERKIDPELYKEATRFALYDHYEHEPGLDVKPWEYAEELRRKNGYRI